MKEQKEFKHTRGQKEASRVLVVIPTYNERESLPRLLDLIFSLRIPSLHIMVVDDNSPDGTGILAEKLAKKHPITVIHRPRKTGLGTAYVEAFQRTLKCNYDYIIQMDADLSHDPKDIIRFLDAIRTSDLVLGSRYMPGGGIENWNSARKFISRFGNMYARIALRLPFTDLTGGYKCFRKRTLEQIDFSLLSSVGYNFQIETTYMAYKQGCSIQEIPITFHERKGGKSKFDIGIIIESFIKIAALAIRGKYK